MHYLLDLKELTFAVANKWHVNFENPIHHLFYSFYFYLHIFVGIDDISVPNKIILQFARPRPANSRLTDLSKVLRISRTIFFFCFIYRKCTRAAVP